MAGNFSRPDPDELLARVKAEDEHQRRGKLKIFLGYAAGVGKTYTMLEAARQRLADTDIVVALVETHGRKETETLLQGMEVIPRRDVEYRGIKLREMDIDAVLARRPELVLVDELAHDNAPSSRHPKRYQDVEELLEAGIDVYTTLNVQHIESGRNVVAQVTGVWVRETVPDSFIDDAAQIELVDLPPDELLKRLEEGKVYVPEQIARATDRFFKKGNLTALRELALRTAARHVDEQTLRYMKTHAIPGPWASGERLLVCITPRSAGSRLIRSARRLTSQAGVEWFATYVETPDSTRLTTEKQEQITDSLRLAERLGATAITLQGESVARAVTDYARENNVSRIIIAKSPRHLFRRSLADELIKISGDIDVYVVSAGAEKAERTFVTTRAALGRWRDYLSGAGVVLAATLLGETVHQLFSAATMLSLYLLAVVITAYFWGLGPSILASFLGVLAFDFFFVQPMLSFSVSDTQYIITFLVLLFVGVVISYLTSRVRRQTVAARRRERETASLYALGRELAVSNDLSSYIRAIVKRAGETFARQAIVFLPDAPGREMLKPYGDGADITVDENELAAALWSFQHQGIVGHGTDTLPSARAIYLPLITGRGTVGVLALSFTKSTPELTIEQERLLKAYADLAAVAIESILLGEEANNAQVLRDTEKLQTALLNSVSHDLRTPLVSIIGVLSSLQEASITLDDTATQSLVQMAREEAERLNHLISNLLDVSRVEAGAIRMSLQPAEVEDLVGAALEQLGERARERSVVLDIPVGLPFVSVDFGLIVQTLVNVLDNAFKYSPVNATTNVAGRQVSSEVYIEVADRGVGIPPQDLLHVFDKFYRIQRPDNVTGTGLGLSICKGIVEAHSGRITAENRPGGGTIIRLILPMAEQEQNTGEKPHG
jgi:two-component system, OmpR family, sensor histidine kinase KdpD